MCSWYRIDFAQPPPPPRTSPYEKPPHDYERVEFIQRTSPGQQITHVYVERIEAGALEYRCHFEVTVDALFT